MTRIVVTGAAGSVGRRTTKLLAETPGVEAIVAIDQAPMRLANLVESAKKNRRATADDAPATPEPARPVMEEVRLDLGSDDDLGDQAAEHFSGADSVVHLAAGRRGSGREATAMLQNVLGCSAAAGVKHLVLVSSALVYGAYADNPVPITEAQPVNPCRSLDYAVEKAHLEDLAWQWSTATGGEVCVLRAAVAFAEGESSWIGSALRAGLSIRPEQVDPPVQFVHLDDLASAVAFAASQRLTSAYNVSADSWIGADAFRALRGESEVRLPERVSRLRMRAAKSLVDRSLLDGLEPYVANPWVMANDKLRSTGWSPCHSNEEVYVAGTSAPLASSISPQKRQELALGVAGVAGTVLAGGAVWALNRLRR